MKSEISSRFRVGTSGWSYKDWVGPFYPEGCRQGEYLDRYAEVFDQVEVDSTFYRVPSLNTVDGWKRRTPDHFRFALKVPGEVTHGTRNQRPTVDKVLLDEENTLDSFLEAVARLGDKAAVLLFQFPYFRVKEFDAEDFTERLANTLARVPDSFRYAAEIRNKTWLTPAYLELLRRHRVAAVLVDHPYMPPPREQVEIGMVTTDFTYLRLLGDRYGIEKITKKWGEVVVEKDRHLASWARGAGRHRRAPRCRRSLGLRQQLLRRSRSRDEPSTDAGHHGERLRASTVRELRRRTPAAPRSSERPPDPPGLRRSWPCREGSGDR